MESELEKLICKAIPLPSCPQKKEAAVASRAWLKKELLKLFTSNKPGPSLTK